MSPIGTSNTALSESFQRAVDKFQKDLTPKQKQGFLTCTLSDVQREIATIQEQRGNLKAMRNMARMKKFLEGMDQYGKVVEVFLNCTPFLGYVWGPIKFILLATNTFVESLDTLLDAYQEIGERLPFFSQYRMLFQSHPEMCGALELYFCDILEFHHHALRLLNRPGWKNLFKSSWKTFDSQFQRILDSLRRHTDLIESGKSTATILELQMSREKAESHFVEMIDFEKRKQLTLLAEKLNATDSSTDQESAKKQRQGTQSGRWVLHTTQFTAWSESHISGPSLLYIHGVPGAGKTTLASLIIEELQIRGEGTVLYFYCKHDRLGKQTFKDILRGLLIQMANSDRVLMSCLYEKCASVSQTGSTTLLEKLATISFESQTISFVVLDGLDECESREVEETLSWFTTFQNATKLGCGQIRLLCIGQRTETLQRMLSSAMSISLETTDHKTDITEYVKSRAQTIKDEFEINPQITSEIVARITAAAQSMFLFARLVLDHLSNQCSQHDLLEELEPENFPVDLKDAYERVLSGILNGPHSRTAIHIIEWVACTSRPMRWREVQALFFIDPKAGTCDYRGRMLRKSCKRLCGSLIDLRWENYEELGNREDNLGTEAILSLVHQTAREYLVRKGLLNISLQHAKMNIFCTQYLISTPFCLSMGQNQLGQLIEQGYFALHEFAILQLNDLLSLRGELPDQEPTKSPESLNSLVEKFREIHAVEAAEEEFMDENPSEVTGISSPSIARTRIRWDEFEQKMSLIRDTIDLCRDKAESRTEKLPSMDQIYGLPKFKCRHIECRHFCTGFASKSARAQHLLRHNRSYTCVESGCPYQTLGFSTETQLAGHRRRAHADSSTEAVEFPKPFKTKQDDLHEASARGDLVAVERFLDSEVPFDSPKHADLSDTPLVLAARNSHLDVCKALLRKGANVNAKQGRRNKPTPLHEAVANNDLEMLQCFLDAQPYAQLEELDGMGKTPLQKAVGIKATAVADVLLYRLRSRKLLAVVQEWPYGSVKQIELICNEGDLDLDYADAEARTPLSYSAERGNEEVAEWFLATKLVNPDSRDKLGNAPLHHAASSESQRIVSLLLASDQVDPDPTNHVKKTPLSIAAMKDRHHVVRILLRTDGVNPNSKDRKECTALHHAAHLGMTDATKALLEDERVSINCKDAKGRTPLSLAAAARNLCDLQLLLATDSVNPNSCDINKKTPLHYAIEGGKVSVFEVLIAVPGIILTCRDRSGRTILHYAADNVDTAILDILLAGSIIPLDITDASGRAPLHHAAANGRHTAVKRILANSTSSAALNARDSSGRTAFFDAVALGYGAVIKALLSDERIDVNTQDPYGETPLIYAVRIFQTNVVKLLLDSGRVEIDVRSSGIITSPTNRQIKQMLKDYQKSKATTRS